MIFLSEASIGLLWARWNNFPMTSIAHESFRDDQWKILWAGFFKICEHAVSTYGRVKEANESVKLSIKAVVDRGHGVDCRTDRRSNKWATLSQISRKSIRRKSVTKHLPHWWRTIQSRWRIGIKEWVWNWAGSYCESLSWPWIAASSCRTGRSVWSQGPWALEVR